MDAVETRIISVIEKNSDKIKTFARDIYDHGELGYKEFRTAEKFSDALKALDLKVEGGLAITGVKGYLKGKRQGVTLALIGELDALRIPTHDHANPETGAAHCCGHHAQLAGVLGAAIALSDPEVASALEGEVVFFAVPAEEYGEIEFKNKLKSEGRIEYGGGKCELIRIGAFDDIDLAIAHHTEPWGILVGHGSSNGFVSKVIRVLGREAHAAAAPEQGINALNAASLGLSALAFERETFRDEDSVRVHPILTKGGNLVNVVPNEAVIETLVRAGNVAAIEDANRKVDRAFIGAAKALGAGVEIETLPGYLPCIEQPANAEVLEAARQAAPGKEVKTVSPGFHVASSTDVGDLMHIMPVLSFNTGGVAGGAHTDKFRVTDEDEAYILTAKIFALSVYKLLKDRAKAAKKVVEEYAPNYTKAEYLDYMDALSKYERMDIEDE